MNEEFQKEITKSIAELSRKYNVNQVNINIDITTDVEHGSIRFEKRHLMKDLLK